MLSKLKMKRTLGTLSFLLICILAFGQEENGMKTMISKGTQINGFGSFDMKYTNLIDRPSLIIGAQGGVLLDHHFYVGGAGYGLATNVQFESNQDGETYNLKGGYAGVMLGGVIAPSSIVHLYIPVLVGAGSFDVSDPDYNLGGFPREITIESSAFFVIEPGLQLDINIARFFRLGLGGSWRFVEGSEFNLVNNDDLSNWAAEISFRFGRF